MAEVIVTQPEMSRFKKAMEKKRRELVSQIHADKSQLAIGECEHDPIDQVQSVNMREENATRLGRRSSVLAEIDRSLHAILEGSYGLCIDCEEPISLKRLEFIPWALRCLHCQQRMEFRQQGDREAA